MTARRLAAALVAALTLAALAGAWGRIVARGRYALPYSTQGAGPEGTRALSLFLARRGLQPRRWAEEFSRLPEGGTLLALGGCDQPAVRPLARSERAALLRWIERGGLLVSAGAPGVLPSELGVRLTLPSEEACLGEGGLFAMIVRSSRRADAERSPKPQGGAAPGVAPAEPDLDDGPTLEDLPAVVARDPGAAPEVLAPDAVLPDPSWARATGAPLRGLGLVGLRRAGSITLDDGVSARTLLTLGDRPAAVERSFGRGRVVVLASASLFQNRDLVASGGAAAMARLLEGRHGPLLFDEYHLGAGERRSMMRYVVQTGLGTWVVQLALAALFALAWAGTRFGGARVAQGPAPSGTASFVAAVGALFSRSGDGTGALGLVARHALGRIASHHRLHVHAEDGAARLAGELRMRRASEGAAAVEAIAALARAGAPSPRDLVRHVRAIDAHVARALRDEKG